MREAWELLLGCAKEPDERGERLVELPCSTSTSAESMEVQLDPRYGEVGATVSHTMDVGAGNGCVAWLYSQMHGLPTAIDESLS